MRPSATRLSMRVEYYARHCRIHMNVPRGMDRTPLNFRHDNPKVIDRQKAAGQDIEIALFTGYFDPIHPMHVVLAAQAMIKGCGDGVVFLPNEASARKPNATPLKERMQQLSPFIDLFEPLFMLSPLKGERSNPEMVQELRTMNSEQVNFNWIASSSGKSGRRILQMIEAGKSLDHAIDEVISPFISKYLFFYYEGEKRSNPVARRLLQLPEGRARWLMVPEQFSLLIRLHSTLFRLGDMNCRFGQTRRGVAITFDVSSL